MMCIWMDARSDLIMESDLETGRCLVVSYNVRTRSPGLRQYW